MPYKDPEKQKEAQRVWAQNNKKPKSEQTSWLKRKEMVRIAKDKPCQICKIKYDSVVMDLHHTDPNVKDSGVAKLMKSASYSKLQEEIDKCVVLCANCHRLLHADLVDLVL
jgi:hypothetical protein